MELALQVVGLKMTGKIEDARDVAMRIVNTTGPDNMNNNVTNAPGGPMQLAGSSRFSADLLHLLSTRSGEVDDTKTAPDDDLWLSDLDGEHEKSNNTRPVKQPRSPSPSTQLECKRIFVCIV